MTSVGRSVRWRITVLAAGIVALVLLLAAIGVVVGVRRAVWANLDRSLELRAEQVAAAAVVDPASALASADREDRFAQLLDSEGRVIAASDNVEGASALAALPPGAQAVSTRTDLPIEDDRYRVLIRRVDQGDRFVVVGENLDDIDDGIRALAVTLASVFPAVTLLLALAVWWLVGRTLRPVEEIRREVESLGLAELDRRVTAPGTGDEIDRLAATMNEMLTRLEIAAASQRQFVADASHELRTPLTRLRTALEVDLADDSSDFEATCRAALGDAIDMQTLVDDLLFLARRDAGHGGGRREPIDLDVLVDDEVRRMREEPSDVTIDRSAVSAASCEGDPRQLARVMRNLLSNAVRHARSTVTITLEEAGGDAVLRISDDGPGVAPADRERVFERFVRLDPARSAAGGGSGLGLAIVRDIVLAHGGSVTIEDAPGGGASFVVRLPV